MNTLTKTPLPKKATHKALTPLQKAVQYFRDNGWSTDTEFSHYYTMTKKLGNRREAVFTIGCEIGDVAYCCGMKELGNYKMDMPGSSTEISFFESEETQAAIFLILKECLKNEIEDNYEDSIGLLVSTVILPDENGAQSYGSKIYDRFFKQEKWGVLAEFKNPNSGNMLRTYGKIYS